MQKNALIILGFSVGITSILWVASILKIIQIPDGIVAIQLTAHLLINLILYLLFISILPKYLTFNFVKKQAVNQAVIYGSMSLIVAIAQSFTFYLIYSDVTALHENSIKVFFIIFIPQIIVFIYFIFLNDRQKLLPGLYSIGPTLKNISVETKETLHIKGQKSKEKLVFLAEELLFIKSSDNYSEFYLFKDQVVNRKMIRLTLKNTEEQLTNYPYIVRSHKSYIVNLKQDIRIQGNANDTKIFLNNFTIPVSRSKRKNILTVYEDIQKSI